LEGGLEGVVTQVSRSWSKKIASWGIAREGAMVGFRVYGSGSRV